MTLKYADFSGGRPGAAALKAAGFAGVVRYVGIGSPGKRITAPEYADYAANQVDVLLVFEGAATDVAGGYAAGVANATAALNDAASLGTPVSVPIAAACDSHVGGSVTAANAVAYAQGAASVLGTARTGFYGFSDTLAPVHAAGAVSWYWLCGTQPTAAQAAWVNLWQDNTQTQTVAGVSCDVNWTYAPLATPEDDLTPDQANQLAAVFNQIVNPYPSEVPGATAKLTLVDFVRAIDARTYANLDAKASAVLAAIAKIPTTPATLSDAQVATVAASVEAAIKASGVEVDAASIAAAVVALLASKLSSGN